MQRLLDILAPSSSPGGGGGGDDDEDDWKVSYYS
jgi:hypothetical protein